MYNYLEKREHCRKKRTLRVRKSLRGSEEKPRLSIVKSNQNIYVQLINDDAGVTISSYSSVHKDFDKSIRGRSKESAKIIGKKIAEMAKDKNVTHMVVDRGRNKYHGLLAELVTAVRESGIVV